MYGFCIDDIPMVLAFCDKYKNALLRCYTCIPKSENDVRLQAKLGSKNPHGLARGSSQTYGEIIDKVKKGPLSVTFQLWFHHTRLFQIL